MHFFLQCHWEEKLAGSRSARTNTVSTLEGTFCTTTKTRSGTRAKNCSCRNTRRCHWRRRRHSQQQKGPLTLLAELRRLSVSLPPRRSVYEGGGGEAVDRQIGGGGDAAAVLQGGDAAVAGADVRLQGAHAAVDGRDRASERVEGGHQRVAAVALRLAPAVRLDLDDAAVAQDGPPGEGRPEEQASYEAGRELLLDDGGGRQGRPGQERLDHGRRHVGAHQDSKLALALTAKYLWSASAWVRKPAPAMASSISVWVRELVQYWVNVAVSWEPSSVQE